MGRTRNRAEQRCPGCGQSKTLDSFRHAGWLMTTHCNDCRQANGESVAPKPRARTRLMQELRIPGAQPMTEQECALVGAARTIASRQWDITRGHSPELYQRLHAALFAAGLHPLSGNYPEAARIRGSVIIDVVLGDADDLTTRVLDLARRGPYEAGAWLLITEADMPRPIADALERHARRPIGIYPQIES